MTDKTLEEYKEKQKQRIRQVLRNSPTYEAVAFNVIDEVFEKGKTAVACSCGDDITAPKCKEIPTVCESHLKQMCNNERQAGRDEALSKHKIVALFDNVSAYHIAKSAINPFYEKYHELIPVFDEILLALDDVFEEGNVRPSQHECTYRDLWIEHKEAAIKEEDMKEKIVTLEERLKTERQAGREEAINDRWEKEKLYCSECDCVYIKLNGDADGVCPYSFCPSNTEQKEKIAALEAEIAGLKDQMDKEIAVELSETNKQNDKDYQVLLNNRNSLIGENARLRDVLIQVKLTIEKSARDTIWFSDCETVCDYIEKALEEGK